MTVQINYTKEQILSSYSDAISDNDHKSFISRVSLMNLLLHLIQEYGVTDADDMVLIFEPSLMRMFNGKDLDIIKFLDVEIRNLCDKLIQRKNDAK